MQMTRTLPFGHISQERPSFEDMYAVSSAMLGINEARRCCEKNLNLSFGQNISRMRCHYSGLLERHNREFGSTDIKNFK